MKPIIGKWYIGFYKKCSNPYSPKYKIGFKCFKLTSIPKEGEALTKKHYKGFIW